MLASVLCTTPALTAQGNARTFIVTLREQAFPDRVGLLEQLRAVIRGGGSSVEYQRAIDALRAKHEQAIAGVRTLVGTLGGSIEHDYWALGGVAVRMTPASASTLTARRSDILLVQDDLRVGASIINQTSAANHNADAAQAIGLDGSGATLALLDSGIDVEVAPGGPPHPAFDDATGTTRIVRAIGIADPLDVEDLTGHGTAVAGIAAARRFGVSPLIDHGFAPGARIASYKITHDLLDNAWQSDWIAAWHAVLADRVSLDIRAAVASYRGSPDPVEPTQRILDIVGFYGDVLIATSAGNGGEQPLPAASSQSNANGLAVAAVQGGTHRVAAFSSEGPLPGDPLRYWPDIAAVGVQVFAPAPNNPVGVGLPVSGTSFAAPCVAGSACLLRGALPSLSALETKAILLNSVADLDPANPNLNRAFYGLGLLRTDLAAISLLSASRWSGASAPTNGATISIPFQANVGVRYAATLTWPRSDAELERASWNDLDLRVIEPGGAVISAAESPRNLYERALFSPRVSGQHRLEIVGVDVSEPDLPWALVVAPNLGGGRQLGTIELVGVGCSGDGTRADVVVPPTPGAATFADSRTTQPFADAPTRLQLAYDGMDIPAGTVITGLAFRLDEAQNGSPAFECDLEVSLGHTLTHPTALSSTFAANPATTVTPVFRSPQFRFDPTSSPPGSADEFDFVIPLTTPFVTSTSATRHLLIEIKVTSHTRNSQPFGVWFDAVSSSTTAGRVITQGTPPFAPVGSFDTAVPIVGLVTPPSAAGSNMPRLDIGGDLALGGECIAVLRGAPPGAAASLLHGRRDDMIGALPLPFDLSLIGAPGCLLRVDPDVQIGLPADNGGQSRVRFTIAPLTVLIGYRFVQQFLVLDPSANAFGITLSNAGVCRIGGP